MSSGFTKTFPCLLGIVLASSSSAFSKVQTKGKTFRAGVAKVDISPIKLPVISSGSFLTRSGSVIHDRLFARGLALDDGTTRLVFVVADTLFVPRDLCDEVKEAASKKTGVPIKNMMISATHTHSGGSVLSALGTKADPEYSVFLPGKLVECIEKLRQNRSDVKGSERD